MFPCSFMSVASIFAFFCPLAGWMLFCCTRSETYQQTSYLWGRWSLKSLITAGLVSLYIQYHCSTTNAIPSRPHSYCASSWLAKPSEKHISSHPVFWYYSICKSCKLLFFFFSFQPSKMDFLLFQYQSPPQSCATRHFSLSNSFAVLHLFIDLAPAMCSMFVRCLPPYY